MENIIEIEEKDSIGNLRRELNKEMLSRENFHKYYTQLKNLPEFFDLTIKDLNNGSDTKY